MRLRLAIALLLALLPLAVMQAAPLELWYDTPAKQWVEALPVGNGRMGAMDYGGTEKARWQFNEDTLWTGGPHNYARAGASKYLPEIRQLLFDGKQEQAERLAMKNFMSVPLGQMAYQPCGDLRLEFPGHKAADNYRRSLDLDSAIITTTYQVGGTTYTRETLASYPDRAIMVRLSADKPASLEFAAQLTSPQADLHFCHSDDKTLLMTGRVADSKAERSGSPKGQMKFAVHLRITDCDGTLSATEDELKASGATHATLILTAGTNFENFRSLAADPLSSSCRDLQAASEKSFETIRAAHVADHQALFRRVSLDLGPAPQQDVPTDERVIANHKQHDPALAALLFQYGRYLLIASSRPGSQPANLQGVWNDEMAPPWDSKYTTNINAEMNYWPSEPANLSECGEPLFQALRELAQSGAITAREHYNAGGWVHHHNFDIWRGTAPINASDHGIWPTGAAWLVQHLWWHYQFTGDREFLRTTAYPLMKGASTFFIDFLIEDPRTEQHWLISGPSNSPEQGGLVMGPTMDHQIIRNLFSDTIAAAEVLNVDAEFRAQLAELRGRIAPNKIGKHGQLQEWLEDVDDPSNRHRHVSHLWGVFPGSEITRDTPDLIKAAQKSLEMRGDGGTGWSLAWKINLWARFLDGDHAHKMVQNLLKLTGSKKVEYEGGGGGGVYPNLFDAHPPFQIDGNFGFTSGVCEMLVQSHRTNDQGETIIDLLPALPSAWTTGKVTGLRTRGGFELDLEWADGKLKQATVRSLLGNPAVFRVGEHERKMDVAAGSTVTIDGELH